MAFLPGSVGMRRGDSDLGYAMRVFYLEHIVILRQDHGAQSCMKLCLIDRVEDRIKLAPPDLCCRSFSRYRR